MQSVVKGRGTSPAYILESLVMSTAEMSWRVEKERMTAVEEDVEVSGADFEKISAPALEVDEDSVRIALAARCEDKRKAARSMVVAGEWRE